MKYLDRLNSEQKERLAKEIGTTVNCLRHYGRTRSASISRFKKIEAWAEKNTPNDIPVLDDFSAKVAS